MSMYACLHIKVKNKHKKPKSVTLYPILRFLKMYENENNII